MTEHHLEITKTARYYTCGALTEQTKQVWIVLHGWGMNIKSFAESFEPLVNESVFLIAPEALNRFYLKSTAGTVGATWMTKEDRLNEIKDYINYLDKLYQQFEFDKYPQIKVTALGFSQGASTVTRWVNTGLNRIDRVIVYAGEVAPELIPLSAESGLKHTDNIFICGYSDEYFTPPLVAAMKENYRELKFTEIEFDGKHIIDTNVLKPLFES